MRRLIATSSIALYLVGCGAGGSGIPVSAIDPSVLAGAWQSPCQNFEGTWLLEELRFVGAQMSRTVGTYADADCSVMTHYISVDKTVEIPAVSEFMPDTYNVNLTVLGSEASAIDPAVADDFSAVGRCDIADWSAGEIIDLSSAPVGCYKGDYPPLLGEITFTIMRPSNNQLEIGQNSSFNDGKSEAKRHISFAEQVFTK